jgi:hypothetical protein
MVNAYQSQIKQPTLEKTPELVAYCAGFFDGEGNISFPGGYISLGVSQRVIEPVQLFQDLFGGSIYYPNGRQEGTVRSMGRDFPKGDVTFRWQKTGVANCRPVLEAFLPLLLTKKRQAELCLEWISLTAPVGSNERLSEEVYNRRKSLLAEIKDAKRPWLKEVV